MKKRRHSLIWLGLILPTLAVGALALFLLNREEGRLRQLRQQTALERARTVADNLDLIMTEIQDGVLQVMQAASDQAPSSLGEVLGYNPFVADYFVLRQQSPGDYLSVSGQGYGQFRKSFAPTSLPWLETKAQQENRTENVKDNSSQAIRGLKAGAMAEESFSQMTQGRQAIRNINQLNISAIREDSSPKMAHKNTSQPSAPERAMRSRQFSERWGWITPADGQPGWAIWYQPENRNIINGFILDSTAVINQLRNAFPAQKQSDIEFLLQSPDGRIVIEDLSSYNDTSFLSSTTEAIPVGGALTGWTLRYRIIPTPTSRLVFLLATLLVILLCLAAMGSGTLLWIQARRDAREAALKTTFVSNVSHELRTPLTTIRMYAEMLEQGMLTNEEKRRRYLTTIVDESQRLTRLVDNILDFSRLEQGRKHYHIRKLDVREIVQKVLSAHLPRLQQAGMILEEQLPMEPLMVSTDPDALEQVMVNLIDNAIKYAASGKRLLVRAEPHADGVHLHIEDSGPGIPRREREHVFQAFHRLDQSLTTNQPGTGLGLTISRNILRELGGDLLLPETPGGGCRFVIALPGKKPTTDRLSHETPYTAGRRR